MDYDKLGVCHFRYLAQIDLREIAPYEADVAPAVALLVLTVPVCDLRAALGGCIRQGVIVAGPEHIAYRPRGVGLEIALHGVVLFHGGHAR